MADHADQTVELVGDLEAYAAGNPYGQGWWEDGDAAAPPDAADNRYHWDGDFAEDSAGDDDSLGR